MNHIVILIQALHLFLVVGVIVAPFVPSFEYKQYALAFLLFLVLQFTLNHGQCGLTEIEGFVLGEKKVDGFLHRLITPVIQFNHSEFYNYVRIFHGVYIFLIVGQLLSFEGAQISLFSVEDAE
jgi:hypothetical protein